MAHPVIDETGKARLPKPPSRHLAAADKAAIKGIVVLVLYAVSGFIFAGLDALTGDGVGYYYMGLAGLAVTLVGGQAGTNMVSGLRHSTKGEAP